MSVNIFWPYYNRNGISDQLFIITEFFKNNNIEYKVSSSLSTCSTNLMIENFDQMTTDYVDKFCNKHDLKIDVLVTEFITKKRNLYFLNDIKDPLDLNQISNNPFINRFYYLNSISKHINSFISILNIPDLTNYMELFNVDCGYRLDISFVRDLEPKYVSNYDFYFSGQLTKYRLDIINDLSKKYSIYYEKDFIPEAERIINLNKCKFSLNIPQSPLWKWNSIMRIIFSIRCGKYIVNLNESPETIFDDYMINISNMVDESEIKKMDYLIKTNLFSNDVNNYLKSLNNSFF